MSVARFQRRGWVDVIGLVGGRACEHARPRPGGVDVIGLVGGRVRARPAPPAGEPGADHAAAETSCAAWRPFVSAMPTFTLPRQTKTIAWSV